MNPEEQGKWRPPVTSTLFTLDRTSLPLDIILHMANYMTFVDYRNFIKALWSNNDECESIREKLWQLSTHKIQVSFINGAPLEIEYNYDPSRPKKERILVNFTSLLSIFGATIGGTPMCKDFTAVRRIQDFIQLHCHLDMCTDRRYASCLCYLVNRRYYELVNEVPAQAAAPADEQCSRRHFHHYCSLHVTFWLNFYVIILIRQQVTQTEIYDEIEAARFLHYLRNTVCLRNMGQRTHRSDLN